jgi:hypothetical protein
MPGLGVRVQDQSVYTDAVTTAKREWLRACREYNRSDVFCGEQPGLPAAADLAGEFLGGLAGAHAEITAGTQRHRVKAGVVTGLVTVPVAGVLVGMTKKSSAVTVVVFSDSSVFEQGHQGPSAIEQAQRDVIRFNALAGVPIERGSS